MTKKEKLDEECLPWAIDMEEEDETILFKCIDCGEEDEVPDFIVDEYSYDLKKGEEVETACPVCDGIMRRAKNVPSE
ncbi:hypothetical protein ACFVAD_24225 [Sutcliffiella sp. NPDC057660]|uniref:hypothetical protein n=1 Tax=Sutcliffiella sp. NPDC057660 TaxID=3346199 RepID=UPI0036A46729